MTYLRHANRHLLKTMEDNLRSWLNANGWMTPPVLFGTTPVTITSRRMRESELSAITGNMVGVFLGPESNDEEIQLGGGFKATTLEATVDVVAVNEAIGLALASDIKDYFQGRVPNLSRFFHVRDYTTDPAGVPLADWQCEVMDVKRIRPDNAEVKAFWQVLVMELELSFPGDDG